MKNLCPWGGKVQFTSERQARFARRTIDRKGHNVNNMRIYKCPNCYLYHFTSAKR